MKQRIKTWLIHRLGGITRTEACNVKRDTLYRYLRGAGIAADICR